MKTDDFRVTCRSPGLFRPRTRWSPRVCASRREVRPSGLRRARKARRRAGPARARRRQRTARRSSSITRISPTRWKKRWPRCGPLRAKPPHRGVRLRRRPRPGQAADDGRDRGAQGADVVIVTDDNPRSRGAGERSAPPFWPRRRGAQEIGDRAEAIRAGVAMLEPGDGLLIAGKGHETGQIVGNDACLSPTATSAQAALKGAP